MHLIAEFRGARNLLDPVAGAEALQRSAEAAGATVLDVCTHDFGDRDGFTGVALLAESHISVHTWPEHGYAAIDIFMCGRGKPDNALKSLEMFFGPTGSAVTTLSRGLGPV